MIEVKISKTVAKSYQDRSLSGFPLGDGMHQVSEMMAINMRDDAYQQWLIAVKPTDKAAWDGLFRQLDKGLMPPEKVEDIVSHEKQFEKFILIERGDILINDQVRSVFDDQSVAELAEDIKEHGLINPITVRPASKGNVAYKYILIAGERRMRACEMAGVPIIAQVIDADPILAKRIQLAENIHREDLGIADKAKAIRDLYDELGRMQAVADLVKKSKSWVSKLVAVTEPDFGWRAKELLENGICEDLELLGILSQIEKNFTWNDGDEAAVKIKDGKLNRNQARDLLQSLKDRKEEEAKKVEKVVMPIDKDLKDARDEEKEARKAMQKANLRMSIEEELRLDPLEVLNKLVKIYVLTEERSFDGDSIQVATEFSTVPYSGNGSDLEIKQLWRTAVESLGEHMGVPVTLEYFQENS